MTSSPSVSAFASLFSSISKLKQPSGQDRWIYFEIQWVDLCVRHHGGRLTLGHERGLPKQGTQPAGVKNWAKTGRFIKPSPDSSKRPASGLQAEHDHLGTWGGFGRSVGHQRCTRSFPSSGGRSWVPDRSQRLNCKLNTHRQEIS